MPEFRADRLATLYVFHPLRRLLPRGTRIPILMYHSISDANDSSRHPYYRTVTAPRVFEQHLRFLHDRGYKTISLSEAVRRLREPEVGVVGVVGVDKAVVITFDDGFQDFYSRAFPLLTKYGYSATVFLPTAYIDHNARDFNGVQCLTWSQVRELQRMGVQFGSHTVTHPQLNTLSPKDVGEEVRRSKEGIEEELGCPAVSFSYPYAFPENDAVFRERLRNLLLECKYENGVSTVIGTSDRTTDIFFLKRLPLNSYDDCWLFEAKIEGGYDWLRAPQLIRKVIRAKCQ
jgi:peptidoglycan/xylan/chitin deacetylase (PgdA/CDA1 family)